MDENTSKKVNLIEPEEADNLKQQETILESPMMHIDEDLIKNTKLLKTHSDTTSNIYLKAEENFFKKIDFPNLDDNEDTSGLHTPIKLTKEPSIAESNNRKCSSVDLEKNLDFEEELKNLEKEDFEFFEKKQKQE